MCILLFILFFFKQKTAYEMRISDWSSDVCSSDLADADAILLNEAVRTQIAHLHLAFLRLAEMAGVEIERRIGIGRRKFVPAEMLRFHGREHVALRVDRKSVV